MGTKTKVVEDDEKNKHEDDIKNMQTIWIILGGVHIRE